MTFLPGASALRTQFSRSVRTNPRRGLRADSLIQGLRSELTRRTREEAGQSAPRVYGYGLAKVPTTRVFREITSDGHLHLVDAIAADEIDGVFAYLVNDAFVWPGDFPGQLKTDGTIFSGRFSGTGRDGKGPTIGSRIRTKLGAAGQVADPDLVSRTSADSSFVGTGIAYVYSEWVFIEGLFDGDPEIGVIARMRKPVDPRDQSVRWSFNPYVHVYDIFTKSADIGGAGVDASLLGSTFGAGANWSDMTLDSPPITKTAILTTETNTQVSNHVLEFDDAVAPFSYGDVVRVVPASGQILPPNYSLGVDYHVIPVRHAVSDFQIPGIALAATLTDALEGNFIPAGTRTTDLNIQKVKEVRYVSGFAYDSSEDPLSVIRKMLESCGASLYLDDGKIEITRQNFPATVETVTEDEIRPNGQVAITNALPGDDRATEFTGVFTSLLNLLDPVDYPKVDGGGIYEAQDGERIPKRLELPFVQKAGAAQRLASIALRRRRQERGLTFSGSLSLYRLKPGTIFSLDKPSLSLDSATTWEVRDQTLFINIDGDQPTIGIDIVARQLESTTFDTLATDEELVDAAKIPGLDSPFDPNPPGEPQVDEDLFVTTNGAGVKARATVSWTASTGGFVRGYKLAYKLTSATSFTRLPETPDLTAQILDIAPGTYEFQVTSVNTLGLESEASSRTFEILALSAPPSDPTGFEGQQQNQTVILQWDLSPDLDVRFGGQVEIRHQSDIAGGKSGDSRLLTQVDGNLTIAQVAFVRGTYYLSFLDQQGNRSGFVEWSTDEVRPVPFGQTITSGAFNSNDGVTENQVTLSESPTFPSTNPGNTLTEDAVNQWLELPVEGGIDSISNIDDVTNIDDIPAGDSVATEGVWFFDQDIELTAAARVLWEAEIETEVVDVASGIDAVTNIDDVPNIDVVGAGTAQPGQATAWIEVRYSRGTVASDTFGPWERLESRILFHRSFQFRIQARSFLPTVNIRVKTARLFAREVPFDA